MQIAIRALGIAALILGIIPFQFKKHKHIVLCKMASETTFALQYFCMGPHAYTGAWMDLVSGLRNFLFYKLVAKNRSTTPVILAFSALLILLGVISWNGPMSLLPLTAKILTTVSYGMKNERLLRLLTLPSCLFWIAYNVSVGAWEAVIADGLGLCSLVIAIVKFDLLTKKKQSAPSGEE